MAIKHTVKAGETLNQIASQYGFSNYKTAGVTAVPSGNFDLIRPGEVIDIPNAADQGVQQTTTQMRTVAAKNGSTLDEKLTNITGANQTKNDLANQAGDQKSTVTVTRDQDNGDGTRTVTYSDGTTARVTATKNPDGTESYKEMSQEDGINKDLETERGKANADAKAKIDFANTTLDGISAQSTAANQALIQSIKDTYSARIKLMEDSNDRVLKAKTQEGIRSGRSRYVSEVQSGILTDEEQTGIARVGQLQGEMLSLIAQAEKARTDKDLEIFNDRMSRLNEIDDNLQTEVQNLQKNAMDQLKAIQDKDKAELQAQKDELQMQLDRSERAAPVLLENMKTLKTEEERNAFIEEYSKISGIPTDILLGDITKATTEDEKADLAAANIRSQISDRQTRTALATKKAAEDKTKEEELTDSTKNVINGIATLEDVQEKDLPTVQAELQSLGFYNPDPPQWYVNMIKDENADQTLAPQTVSKLWMDYRTKAGTI